MMTIKEFFAKVVSEMFTEKVYCIGVSMDDIHYTITPLDDRHWCADPMLYSIGEKYYVLSEVMDRYSQYGYIAISEIQKDGKLSRPIPIIKEPFHMSFPTIFEWNNNMYMLPETSAAGELRFYKEGKDLFDWQLSFSVPGVVLVDTVILRKHEDDNILFLIGSIPEREDPQLTKLAIYRLDMESGKADEIYRNSEPSYHDRNGGSLLRDEEGWIRIAQESTRDQYGRNIIAFRIKDFPNEMGESYSEEFLYKLEVGDLEMIFPKSKGKWKAQFMHTYGRKDEIYVIDINVRHTAPWILLSRVKRICGRSLLKKKNDVEMR